MGIQVSRRILLGALLWRIAISAQIGCRDRTAPPEPNPVLAVKFAAKLVDRRL